MSHLQQRIEYQQRRRALELETMRRAWQLKVEAENRIIAERKAKVIALAERREQWRREREAAAEAELRKRFADGTIQEAAFTFDEVKAMNPCGRAEAVKTLLVENGIPWYGEHKVNLLTALNAGATYGDVVWLFHAISRVNPQAKQLWTGFKRIVKDDDYGYDPNKRLEILRDLLTNPHDHAIIQQ